MSASLTERQAAFMRALLDESAPAPQGWGERQQAGMQVYRGNYRSAAMSALAHAFARTAAHVGDAAFRQVAINHVITNPPSHWTVDAVGAGFAESCAAFFNQDPEVAELAWLEWTMLELATAPDAQPLKPQAFADASAGFGDADWMGLTLTMMPRAAARIVGHDLEALWRAADAGERAALARSPRGCLVWREGERPTFAMAEPDNARAFEAMREGASYGEVIVLLSGEDAGPPALEAAAMRAGGFLGQWLTEGMIAALGRAG
ncbi:MAG: DNA-binding domain-containing protein [Erythrobacter sp.]|jgi:hypothetical protein|nr:DNA-binding domain-containing protein [Erythrobacter sp.]